MVKFSYKYDHAKGWGITGEDKSLNAFLEVLFNTELMLNDLSDTSFIGHVPYSYGKWCIIIKKKGKREFEGFDITDDEYKKSEYDPYLCAAKIGSYDLFKEIEQYVLKDSSPQFFRINKDADYLPFAYSLLKTVTIEDRKKKYFSILPFGVAPNNLILSHFALSNQDNISTSEELRQYFISDITEEKVKIIQHVEKNEIKTQVELLSEDLKSKKQELEKKEEQFVKLTKKFQNKDFELEKVKRETADRENELKKQFESQLSEQLDGKRNQLVELTEKLRQKESETVRLLEHRENELKKQFERQIQILKEEKKTRKFTSNFIYYLSAVMFILLFGILFISEKRHNNTAIPNLETAKKNLEGRLKEKDTAISGLETAKTNLEDRLKEKDTAISDLETATKNLEDRLKEKDTAISGLETAKTNLEGRLKEKDTAISGLETAKTNLEGRLKENANKNGETETVSKSATLIVNVENGTVRSTASKNGKIITTLKRKDTVSLIEEWYYIKLNDGTKGWAHNSVFEKQKEADH